MSELVWCASNGNTLQNKSSDREGFIQNMWATVRFNNNVVYEHDAHLLMLLQNVEFKYAALLCLFCAEDFVQLVIIISNFIIAKSDLPRWKHKYSCFVLCVYLVFFSFHHFNKSISFQWSSTLTHQPNDHSFPLYFSHKASQRYHTAR